MTPLFLFIFYIIIAVLFLIFLWYYLNNIVMNTFKKVVIIIGTIILEIIFAILIYFNSGIILNFNYPPPYNICPDYWKYSNNLCIVPTNNKNVGSFNINNIKDNSIIPPGYNSTYKGIDFNDPEWVTMGLNSFCAKQKWANINNIWWDGITNIDNGC